MCSQSINIQPCQAPTSNALRLVWLELPQMSLQMVVRVGT